MFVSNFTYDHGAFGSTAGVEAMVLVVVVVGVVVLVFLWMIGWLSPGSVFWYFEVRHPLGERKRTVK